MALLHSAQERLVREDPYFELEERKVAGVPWRVYRRGAPSLRAVLQATAQFGERVFLVYEGERWTYAQHFQVVTRLAWAWSRRGVGKGDRIAIAMRNYPEWVAAFWAAQALGAIAVPLNAWWTGPELAYALHDCDPKVLVVDGERLSLLAPILNHHPIAQVVVARQTGVGALPAVRWEDELAQAAPSGVLPDVTIAPDDDATIMYTSGTTGRPKGAVATQRNHTTNLRNAELSAAANAADATVSSRANQAVLLQTFPFFHMGGLTGLYVATAMGARLCLMYRWDTRRAAELIDDEGVNSGSMVPMLLRSLLDHAKEHKLTFPSLAGMSSGGAPVPPDLIAQLGDQFEQRVSPGNGYGLTETTSAVVVNSGKEYYLHPDSVGRLVPGADLRIVGLETHDDLPVGTIGELWFRGPNMVRAYWNKPEETAASFTNGWFHTGDVGFTDADGLVYVVDRLKDVVIRGGENVYCTEVEAVLFQHPAVSDVAVIGLPHPVLGEEVVAVVEIRDGASVTALALQEHSARSLARFKVPSEVVFTNEALPRTATGKVLKRDLRQRLALRSARLGGAQSGPASLG